MVFPQACLFRAPIWCPSGSGATRETGSTVVDERMVALYGVITHQFSEGGRQLDRRRGTGVLNSCARESKARTGRFLREKWTPDQGFFSSYKDQQEVANGQDSWGFSRNVHGFGRLNAGSRAGFTSSRLPPSWTSVFQFSLFLYDVWS